MDHRCISWAGLGSIVIMSAHCDNTFVAVAPLQWCQVYLLTLPASALVLGPVTHDCKDFGLHKML